jgi:hypothetical protein
MFHVPLMSMTDCCLYEQRGYIGKLDQYKRETHAGTMPHDTISLILMHAHAHAISHMILVQMLTSHNRRRAIATYPPPAATQTQGLRQISQQSMVTENTLHEHFLPAKASS